MNIIITKTKHCLLVKRAIGPRLKAEVELSPEHIHSEEKSNWMPDGFHDHNDPCGHHGHRSHQY